jgi:SPP1 gp7 family putative phage head morphogenesis protein
MPPKKRDFSRPKRIDALYRFELDDLLSRFFAIPQAFNLSQIAERLTAIGAVGDFFERSALKIASNMVSEVAAHNARSWREAAAQSHQGRAIYRMLQQELKGPVGDRRRELIAENALYIKSIPVDVAVQANSYIAEEQMKGRRSSDIAKDLRERLPDLKRSKIDLITRTEVSKADTAITRARAESISLPCYVWETSEDARVRKSHKKMQGVIVFWNDPPAPEALVGEKSTLGHYHAGNAPNCRCPALPLVTTDEVQWPHAVYSQGKIQRMTLPAFRKLSGMRD